MTNYYRAMVIGFIIILTLSTMSTLTQAQIGARIYGTGSLSSESLFTKLIELYSYTDDVVNIIFDAFPINIVLTQVTTTDFNVVDRAIPNAIKDLYKIVQFPLAGQAIVMSYNIPELVGCPRIIITREIIAQIWLGNIRMWNDSAIVNLNPGLAGILPETNIKIGYNDDTTVSISAITQFSLSSFSAEFATKFASANKKFSNMTLALEGLSVDAGPSSIGRLNWLKNTTYGLTFLNYADVFDIDNPGISSMNIYNKAGNLVEPNIDSVQSAMADYKEQYINNNFAVDIYDAPGNYSWPISYVNYILMAHNLSQLDCSRPSELLDFISWIYTNSAASKAMLALQFYPLEKTLQKVAIDNMFIVSCDNNTVLNNQHLISFGAPISIMNAWPKKWGTDTSSLKYYKSLSSDAINLQKTFGADFTLSINGVDPAYYEAIPDLGVMPLAAFAIVPAYNIPFLSTQNLVLDYETIAGIYLGLITNWNDTRIRNTNTQEIRDKLPNANIIVVVQNTTSDINKLFTTFLSEKIPEFASEIGSTYNPTFPLNPANTLYVNDLDSLGNVLVVTTNSFAFWSDFGVRLLSRTQIVNMASLQTETGFTVSLTPKSLENAVNEYVESGKLISEATTIMASGTNSWPIATFVSMIYRQTTMQYRDKAVALSDFAYWTQTNDVAIRNANIQGYFLANNNPKLASMNLELLKAMTFNGTTISSIANCIQSGTICNNQGICTNNSCNCHSGKTGQYCELIVSDSSDQTLVIVLSIVIPIVILIVLLMISMLILIVFLLRKRTPNDEWEIDFDELEIGESIGNGGFGTVNKALWKGTEVAVKTITAENISKEMERNFKEEVRITTSLRHPNVVLFMAASTKSPKMCIVMEYMSLGSLYELLDNELIPEIPFMLKIKMAYQASKGMHFLHSSGIVHRDLKSLNLLLDSKWNVKVSDFGLTKFKTDLENKKKIHDQIIGTIHWTAPEILNDMPEIDYSLSDIYSFGIILWELATRQHPYPGMTSAAIAVAVIRDGLRPPISSEVENSITPDYKDLIHNCWNYDPAMRPTFLEIMTRLSSMAGDSSITAGTNTSSSSARSGGNIYNSNLNSIRYKSDLSSKSNNSTDSSNMEKPENNGKNARTEIRTIPHPTGEVVVVFTDISSATQLWESDAQIMHDATIIYNLIIRENITNYDGYESILSQDRNSGEGSFCVIFKNALNAIDFCENVQQNLLKANWSEELLKHPSAAIVLDNNDNEIYRGLRVRMGINIGTPKIIQDIVTRRYSYTGPVVDLCAKITIMAHGGQVLVSSNVWNIIKSARDVTTYKIKIPNDDDILDLYEIKITGLEGRFYGGFAVSTSNDSDQMSGNLSTGKSLDRSSNKSINEYAKQDVQPEDNFLTSANMCRWIINYNEIQIGKQIGAGSYGVVSYGVWKNVSVAVKKISKQMLDEKHMLEFRLEIAVLSELQHPNIILFIGACIQKPNICIVTEYMNCGNLKDVINNQSKFPWNRKIRVLHEAAKGIEYLHESKIIHRDIKSSNILVNKNEDSMNNDWDIKIADFGFARIKEENATMTRCGTPCWTAPEIIRGEKYNEKVDVYSFGIVMWEVLTGKHPFVGCNFMKVTLDILEGKRPQIPTDCPPKFKKLMKKCWNQNPNKRPNMSDIVSVLPSFIHGDDNNV
ncbi:putative serine/threonine-protein kinase [Cotonvirus japonicus]|uniref:Serine/threonine-protein kinase n=1 Tax=Cotonvirus japonicus TaxID=2811091 RepID=A0ABM7NRK3_9VIRU|nr:putative serine/threonine-protein kinase [Cotonvirus japonicus]BCS82726.1 putative serine/threonine-protein kinase [Cotonvirus japonicus]